MITIEDDRIVIVTGETSVRFNATGGPEDDIEVMIGPQFGCLMSRDEVEQFQKAFVNFLNTGFFNQEC